MKEENASDSPGLRTHHSCTKFKNNILFYGGDDQSFKMNVADKRYTQTYLLDYTNIKSSIVTWRIAKLYIKNKCSDIDIVPQPRRFHAMTNHSGTDAVILFGGINCNSKTVPYNDIWIFTPLSKPYDGSWVRPEMKSALPEGRWGHTMDCINDSIIIFGGHTKAATNDIFIINIEEYPKNEKDDPLKYVLSISFVNSSVIIPQPRKRHSMSRNSDNDIFIFGGYHDKFYNDLYKLELHINSDQRLLDLLDRCKCQSLYQVFIENNINYTKLFLFTDEDYDKYFIPLGVRRLIQGKMDVISSIFILIIDIYSYGIPSKQESIIVNSLIKKGYLSSDVNQVLKQYTKKGKTITEDILIEELNKEKKEKEMIFKKQEKLLQKELDDLIKKKNELNENTDGSLCCV